MSSEALASLASNVKILADLSKQVMAQQAMRYENMVEALKGHEEATTSDDALAAEMDAEVQELIAQYRAVLTNDNAPSTIENHEPISDTEPLHVDPVTGVAVSDDASNASTSLQLGAPKD